MPAASKAQQRFMGMVHAADKGETPASPEVEKVSADMKDSDAKDFASTKHDGLPDHVKEQLKSVVREVIKEKSGMNEMGSNDIHFKHIMKMYDRGGSFTKKKIGVVVCKNPKASRKDIEEELFDSNYRDITEFEDELGLTEIREKYSSVKEDATELPQATIPAAVKAKLQLAIEKIKDSKLSNNAKLQLLAQVIDAIGIDKSQLSNIASKIRSKMESVVTEEFKHLIHVDTPTQVVSKPIAAQIMALAKKGVRASEIGLEMGFVGNAKLAADTFQKVKNKIYFELDKRNESINEAFNIKDLPGYIFDDPIDFNEWWEDGMELKVGRISPFNKSDDQYLARLVKAWMDAEDDYSDGRGDLGTGKQGAARAASYKAQDAIKQFLNKKSKVANESVNEGAHGMATKILQSVVNGDSSRAEGTKMTKELAQHYIDWIRTSPFGKKNGNLPLDMLVKASFNWGIERGLDSKLKGELSKLKSTIKESVNEASFKSPDYIVTSIPADTIPQTNISKADVGLGLAMGDAFGMYSTLNNKHYRLDYHNGKVALVLSKVGKLAVRIRSEIDPKYLAKIEKFANDYLTKFAKGIKRNESVNEEHDCGCNENHDCGCGGVHEHHINEDLSADANGIAGLTASRANAVKDFLEKNNINSNKLYLFLKKGNLKDRMDFVTALVGKPGNPIQKKVIAQFSN
jgi:hypothetical protein